MDMFIFFPFLIKELILFENRMFQCFHALCMKGMLSNLLR